MLLQNRMQYIVQYYDTYQVTCGGGKPFSIRQVSVNLVPSPPSPPPPPPPALRHCPEPTCWEEEVSAVVS